jgi:hypothetical protein
MIVSGVFGDEPPKLTSASWLIGQWRSGAKEKAQFEEHWTEPAAGAMMGMFRLSRDGKPGVYEFLLLEEEAEGVYLRLRHYRLHMEDIDKAPIRLKLTQASENELVFENPDNDKPKRILYVRESPDKIAATVETIRDGKPSKFTLRMERAK